jgi:hypothetical protein
MKEVFHGFSRCVNTSDTQKKRILALAAEVRKFEIERFWARSIFFWGFIAAAFVAYAQLYNKDAKDSALIVACFGFVCSIAWTLANRGGKYWQEAWEQKVRSAEVPACWRSCREPPNCTASK